MLRDVSRRSEYYFRFNGKWIFDVAGHRGTFLPYRGFRIVDLRVQTAVFAVSVKPEVVVSRPKVVCETGRGFLWPRFSDSHQAKCKGVFCFDSVSITSSNCWALIVYLAYTSTGVRRHMARACVVVRWVAAPDPVWRRQDSRLCNLNDVSRRDRSCLSMSVNLQRKSLHNMWILMRVCNIV